MINMGLSIIYVSIDVCIQNKKVNFFPHVVFFVGRFFLVISWIERSTYICSELRKFSKQLHKRICGYPSQKFVKTTRRKIQNKCFASCDCKELKKNRENTTSTFSKSIIHLVVNRTQLTLKITFCVIWPKYKFLALCRSNRLQSNSPAG